MLDHVLALAQPALRAATADQAGRAFYRGAAGLGATYIQTRSYRRPEGVLDSSRHWAAGGFVTRICKAGWVGSAGFDYVCFTFNPLLDAIRSGRTRYRFSDFAPFDDSACKPYWEALGDAGVREALCATSYGPDGRIASVHIGFGRRDFAQGEAEAVQLAGLMLTEHIMGLSSGEAAPADPPARDLTGRELDAIRFVAEGKSDWELATIMGVSEHTARFHVDNARRKLGAVNRAQAVARLALSGRL